jgi:hypothetical protein
MRLLTKKNNNYGNKAGKKKCPSGVHFVYPRSNKEIYQHYRHHLHLFLFSTSMNIAASLPFFWEAASPHLETRHN